MALGVPDEAGTVPVRVQVVDTVPRIVDLVVPTYLAADDVAHRIARDAGLGGWWEDGSRRGFVLRARGRPLGPDETLQDVGIVPYELIHLLPEPRPGVVERALGVPLPVRAPVDGWSTASRVLVFAGWVGLCAAAAGEAGRLTAWLAGFGVAWWAAPVAHAALFRVRLVPWQAGALALVVVGIAAPAARLAAAAPDRASALLGVVLLGLGAAAGWMVTMLVWLGPEASPVAPAVGAVARVDVAQAVCGVCGGGIDPNVLEACPHGCARVFHRGCARARAAVHQGPGCALCGAAVPGA